MISEELVGLPLTMDEITPEKGNGRRSSTGQMRISVDGKKSVPRYLRASTGSCHDLCKYGRRLETETKPWSSASRGKKIEEKPPEKIATAAEGSSYRKNHLKVKPKSSSDGKSRLPDSSSGGQLKLSTSEKGMLGSDKGKSKAASKHKLLPAPTRLSNPGKTVKEQGLPRLKVSELVSVKVTERVMPTKSATHLNSKAAVTKPAPSSKSPLSLGLRKEKQNMVEIMGIANRISVKDTVISSTSSIPSKSSGVSGQTSIKWQVQRQKTVIGQRNEKVTGERGMQQIEEVSEKTLDAVDIRNVDKSTNFDESSFDMGVQSPTSSLSIVESSAQQDQNPAVLSHAEEKEETETSHIHSEEREDKEVSHVHSEEREEMEKSHVHFSSREEDDDKNDEQDVDEEGPEYPDDESEVYSNIELDENENVEKEFGSNGDSIRRRPRKEWTVHPQGTDGDPVKLHFRMGRVVEIQPVDNAPRRLKFRCSRLHGDHEAARANTHQRRSLKKREISVDNNEDPSSEKHALRHSEIQGKKDAQCLFNDVIEETASKLVETRKSKVKALVGAFETVISLQEDGKPSATEDDAN